MSHSNEGRGEAQVDQADLMPELQEDATDDHPAEGNDSSKMFSLCALVSFRRWLALIALEIEPNENPQD